MQLLYEVPERKWQSTCGNQLIVPLVAVKSGNTKSCGCYNIARIKERNSKSVIHGHTRKTIDGKRYSITCPSNDYVLDRLGPNGDYSPQNCQWITKSEHSSKHNQMRWEKERMEVQFDI